MFAATVMRGALESPTASSARRLGRAYILDVGDQVNRSRKREVRVTSVYPSISDIILRRYRTTRRANGRRQGPRQNPAADPGTPASGHQFDRRIHHANQPAAAVIVVATMTPPTARRTGWRSGFHCRHHTAKLDTNPSQADTDPGCADANVNRSTLEPCHIEPCRIVVTPNLRWLRSSDLDERLSERRRPRRKAPLRIGR